MVIWTCRTGKISCLPIPNQLQSQPLIPPPVSPSNCTTKVATAKPEGEPDRRLVVEPGIAGPPCFDGFFGSSAPFCAPFSPHLWNAWRPQGIKGCSFEAHLQEGLASVSSHWNFGCSSTRAIHCFANPKNWSLRE